MKLTELLPAIEEKFDLKLLESLEISNITSDSRKVSPSGLFFAIQGEKFDGVNFTRMAEKRGAVIIITYSGGLKKCKELGVSIPIIEVENVRKVLSYAAYKWFGQQPKEIVAITGTNGKTSVAAFLKQIWENLGIKCASIGTLGADGISDSSNELTTPDPLSLHKYLAELNSKGVDHIVLEASSHGLIQNRLDHVNITSRAFTNLSRDHLDYHGGLDEYFLAKAILFRKNPNLGGISIVNIDEYYGRLMKLVAEDNGFNVFGVGQFQGSKFRIIKQSMQVGGQYLSVSFDNKTYNFQLKLMGAFQGENVVMAAALAIASGANPDRVFSILPNITAPEGRLQVISEMKSGAKIFLDYAHSPEALRKVLLAVRPHTFGNLSLVFGAGGDRDKGKRKIMGEVAEVYADKVYITDDNPRFENANMIRKEIKRGCSKGIDVPDRAKAILVAISELKSGDSLIVAGKGHERGQRIGNTNYPFDDSEQISMSVELLENS